MMTKNEFAKTQKPMVVLLNGTPMVGDVRAGWKEKKVKDAQGKPTDKTERVRHEFSSGNVGWYVNGKVVLKSCQPLEIEFAGNKMRSVWRQFASKKWGWNVSGKVILEIGDEQMEAQVSGNLIIGGSEKFSTPVVPDLDHSTQVGISIVVMDSAGWDEGEEEEKPAPKKEKEKKAKAK